MSTQALYRMYDADGALLYIGVSLNVAQRMGQHRAEKPWWTDIARIDLEHHVSRRAVLQAEQRAILSEGPLYNVALVPRPALVVVRDAGIDVEEKRAAELRTDADASLTTVCAARQAAEAELADARREEAESVVAALDSGLRQAEIVRLSGYTRETIRRLADAGRKARAGG